MPNWKAGAGGAASGAAVGSSFGPYGAAIGGVAGGLLGLFGGGGGSGDAGNAQRKGLDAAMERLQAGSAEQYQNRMKDLQQTMSFYGPAQRYLQSIYGGPATGPQQMATGVPGRIPGGGSAGGMGPGGPPTPPGFPKMQPPPGPMGYGQGPRRGY